MNRLPLIALLAFAVAGQAASQEPTSTRRSAAELGVREPGRDCNGNGVEDAAELRAGGTRDCNSNGVPDECDIARGRAADLDANGVPDDCETFLAGVVEDMTISRVGLTGFGDFEYYGSASGERAYSFATTSCNEGNVSLPWGPSGSSTHPVIGQNFFRVHDGGLEQLGYSWLKHGFCAVNETTCGSCQGTSCSTLGIGCADTYGSFLNDGQSGNGKADVNAVTGVHSDSSLTVPSGTPNVLRGRLRVETSKMGVSGARYFAEAQYVYATDHQAGNGRNNVSYREINTSSGSGSVNGSGHSVRMYSCGVEAWQEVHPDVVVVELPFVDEGGAGVHGHFVLGYRTWELSGGDWRYEYVLQNLTSDASAARFAIPTPCGSPAIYDVTQNTVAHHSGSPYSNDPWVLDTSGGAISLATESFAVNVNANAIRWGETLGFGFTSAQSPTDVTGEVDLFKVGDTLSVTVPAPCAVGDCDDDGVPDDLEEDCDGSGVPDDCEALPDCNGNGMPDPCEGAPDCDADGVLDECEADCDADGLPDDCEVDCNSNGTPDECESISDCNSNGVPDECEADCDGDGQPDGCEADCNSNGTPDDCESITDCNSNGIPDECEADCDFDGLPDDCEVDCDGSGVPDDCETLSDCDDDGVPDGCEIDLDGDGVPDECQIETYCRAKRNSAGCRPRIGFGGLPSLTGADDFEVTATQVMGASSGTLLWSLESRASLPGLMDGSPFGARLCLWGGRALTTRPTAGTPGACDGALVFPFSQAAMGAAGLTAGVTVYAQVVYADPAHSDGSGLGHTAAIRFPILP